MNQQLIPGQPMHEVIRMPLSYTEGMVIGAIFFVLVLAFVIFFTLGMPPVSSSRRQSPMDVPEPPRRPES
ncbi:hypothetical protein Btus_1433 [Kyrpidia tusciae DSM 2912]|uniref:Uncharacterized protein n=1 Tax=Kyrpidia tusciae (strain DSM 2912 / NBRC 15312 / T2) TaxID=562970 RepID=D5WP87_KYRT2|nr:hypothetical protein Btus_1433 [Kyrpidia tusciae DSM 2912]